MDRPTETTAKAHVSSIVNYKANDSTRDLLHYVRLTLHSEFELQLIEIIKTALHKHLVHELDIATVKALIIYNPDLQIAMDVSLQVDTVSKIQPYALQIDPLMNILASILELPLRLKYNFNINTPSKCIWG